MPIRHRSCSFYQSTPLSGHLGRALILARSGGAQLVEFVGHCARQIEIGNPRALAREPALWKRNVSTLSQHPSLVPFPWRAWAW